MSKIDRRAIGHRIRIARERAGLTREKLAELLKVHAGSIARWETGGSVPHAFTMERIGELTGVTVEWLRTGRENPGDARALIETSAPGDPDDVFASFPHVVRYLEGIGPHGQERARKLDALEGLRRMLTARGALPDWWYLLKERVENGEA
jgi:transcriptional regulator with XRE-family HTH domain